MPLLAEPLARVTCEGNRKASLYAGQQARAELVAGFLTVMGKLDEVVRVGVMRWLVGLLVGQLGGWWAVCWLDVGGGPFA